ncbi:restriction endonuclease subunit S [Prevotellamassilia timonensis]|jgi:type I restriction enzyme S subunit|uniref:restriction endonuclease subunit S n=1 Tax=Prevotellamassilia timonensis TaxID=1852370 RepID=UPI003079404D|nr:restriction endonuclease subunit S [Prevotellamassilia timonensis]
MKEPKIRFKGFSGEWEETKFGNLCSVAMCKRIFKHQTSPQGDIPFYKIGTFGATPDAFISRTLFEEYKKKYNYPQKGDILISAAGTIGRVVEYTGEECYYQDSNIVWLMHSDQLSNAFLKQLYPIINWSSLEGATIKRLYNGNILDTSFRLPLIAEQKLIATFFTTLDAHLSASTSRLASLKQMKAASLQAMFPQEGETVPKVRFKGFKGEWKKVKLGEFGSWSKGKLLSKDNISETGKFKCIHYGELFTMYDEIIYQVFSKTDLNNGCLSQIGDILFPDSDVTPTGLARCSSIMETGVILGGGILILRPLPQYYSPFISLSVNNEKQQIISRITGTTVRHINATSLSEIEIVCTENIAEQQSIASFFTSLDRQITLHAQRLEKLKQIKAACLDKMFV